MLTKILQFITERGSATVKDIALHFQIDISAAEGMLQTLERKGRVERIAAGKCAGCKGCALVDPADFIIYKIPSAR
ncbi:MAG: FeoC-like transcriptional regulator [Kiritimatiellales bacterium]